MKRYLITHPRFNGEVEIIYQDGRLVHVSFVSCNMSMEDMNTFMKRIHADENKLVDGFGKATSIVATDVEITFDMFWKAYQKKINRARCILLWDKMNTMQRAMAYTGIRAYNKYLAKEKWRGKADPETYLRNKYWENEYD